VFPDKLEKSAERLRKLAGNRFAVDDNHRFIGFDANFPHPCPSDPLRSS
jgi:hypothetical protein